MQMGMHKKLLAKLLQLHCLSVYKMLRSVERNVLIMANKGGKENDRQGRQRRSERERKTDKERSQPSKCVDCQMYV